VELTTPSTSRSLVRRVQQGDALAWQRFATIYVPIVYQWTRCGGLQASDALDIVQNVFLSVVRALPAFRHQESGQGLRAWLRTITKNAVIDWHRARGRQLPLLSGDHPQWDNLLADDSALVDSPPADERTLLVLQAAEILRNEFEPATWDMFWQLTVEGRSAEQIAAARAVSTWAVYKAKARILGRFRELIGEF
jgi:RNA polymerase sigma-70 factor, ECF subfamily